MTNSHWPNPAVGTHQLRSIGLGQLGQIGSLNQRPFIESPFSSHFRELEGYRRKPSLSSSGGDCQDYKPNANVQPNGELFFLT